MTDEPKKPLEYDRTPTVVTVRGFRTLVVLTLINTIVLGWFAVTGTQGPQYFKTMWDQWKMKRESQRREAAALADQQKSLAHVDAPDVVLYTEDPRRVAALAVPGGAYRPIQVGGATVPSWQAPVGRESPAHWTALSGMAGYRPGGKPSAVLFLHERQAPGGKRMLVVVHLSAVQRFDESSRGPDMVTAQRQIEAWAYSPFAPSTPARIEHATDVSLHLPTPDSLRVTRADNGSYTVDRGPALTLFAGQPDPDDPSHFTIPYEIDGQAGVLDGWLRDAELLIKPRHGRPLFESGRQRWLLGVAPSATTTAPSSRPAARLTTPPLPPGDRLLYSPARFSPEIRPWRSTSSPARRFG